MNIEALRIKVRLKPAVFAEWRADIPIFDTNEFELVAYETGRWAWILTLRYSHPINDTSFQVESVDLDEVSESTLLSIIGQHDAWLLRVISVLKKSKEGE